MGLETIAIAGLALSAVGTGVGVMGSMQQASAQKSAANYQSAIAANNAKIASDNATRAGQAGEAQAAQVQQETRAKVGAIKAAQAANGVNVNTGSAVDVQSSAAELGELNAITLRSNAARQAYGYQTQEASYDAQSGLDKSTASNAETAGYLNAGSTFLSGAGSAAQNYANYRTKSSNMIAGDGGVGSGLGGLY